MTSSRERRTAERADFTDAEARHDAEADHDNEARRAAEADRDADAGLDSDVPEGPTDLSGRSWWGVLKRTVKEFQRDNLNDWAAALTYYGVLSIFPGLLALVSILGLLGDDATEGLLEQVTGIAPGPTKEILEAGLRNIRDTQGAAGVMFFVGLAIALWSASRYVAAFMRASNAIYDVPEGRPIWKILPIRLAITVVVGVVLVVAALTVVFTGEAARWLGDLVGLGETAVTVWDIAKWPVLLIIISLVFAILYWASPNAKVGGFRWITPGGLVAVVLWIIASAGFAFYIGNFGSYNETYGALGTPIVFLVWLWISNIAILLGAEFDAELHRGRAIESGHPPGKEPYLDLRDTRKVDKGKTSDLS
jgi:membrane protein